MGDLVENHGKWARKIQPAEVEESKSRNSSQQKASLDDSALLRDARVMNDISREEFNAKLEAIEARMDSRIESVSSKIDGFLATQAAVQVERDKAQVERDRRLEMLAERAAKAAEGAEEAAKQAATVKANYWAAVVVQLLAVVAILVGAYYANQANVLGAMQTTMGAFTLGKESSSTPPPQSQVLQPQNK